MGLVAGAIIFLWVSMLTVVSALLIGFATLVFRQMVILLGVVFAPIALAAWVLPGTQKFSKLWYESFSKALAMYPIVMALIAAGKITGSILASNAGTGAEGLAYKLAGFIAWFLPFALIPAALKAGGTVLSKISGVANDRKCTAGI